MISKEWAISLCSGPSGYSEGPSWVFPWCSQPCHLKSPLKRKWMPCECEAPTSLRHFLSRPNSKRECPVPTGEDLVTTLQEGGPSPETRHRLNSNQNQTQQYKPLDADHLWFTQPPWLQSAWVVPLLWLLCVSIEHTACKLRSGSTA